MVSLYDELGVPPDASPDAIKGAHRRKAKKLHPDAGGSAEAFARVQHAYMVLKDPDRRARYDRTGDEETVDDERGKILALISKAFAEVVSVLDEEGDVLTQEPLAKHLSNWFNQHILHLVTEAGKVNVSVAKLEALKGRFKTKAGKHEEDAGAILEGILAGSLAPLKSQAAGLQKSIERHKAAEAIVGAVSFRNDEKPRPAMDGSFTYADLNKLARQYGVLSQRLYQKTNVT